jgi:hypothetical protein
MTGLYFPEVQMAVSRVIRSVFMPFALAAVVAGSVSIAAPALADDDDYYDPGASPFYAPDTYADPATDWVPWASGVNEGAAVAPWVDNTVVCDGCAG